MDRTIASEERQRDEEHRLQQRILQEQALQIARRGNLTKLLSSIVGALGIVAAAISVVLGLGSFSVRTAVEEQVSKQLSAALGAQEKEFQSTLRSVRGDVEGLSKQVRALSTVSSDAKVTAQITRVQQSSEDLATRLAKLESTILEDPEKALAIPLLRNEVEGVKTAYALELTAVRAEVARIYDLNKWFVGLMLTMALGIIGLAVSNFLKPAKEEAR